MKPHDHVAHDAEPAESDFESSAEYHLARAQWHELQAFKLSPEYAAAKEAHDKGKLAGDMPNAFPGRPTPGAEPLPLTTPRSAQDMAHDAVMAADAARVASVNAAMAASTPRHDSFIGRLTARLGGGTPMKRTHADDSRRPVAAPPAQERMAQDTAPSGLRALTAQLNDARRGIESVGAARGEAAFREKFPNAPRRPDAAHVVSDRGIAHNRNV